MFTQFGEAKYTFALATATETTAVAAAAIEAATGIAPQELQISAEPEFIAEAEGPDGTVEGLAVAQKKRTFTLSGFLTDKEKFDEEGASFTHDGKFFICTGNQLGKNTKEFQKAQLTGVCYAGITSAVA
jgi:hypothetical protein